MAKCPKCDAEYESSVEVCESCGQAIGSVDAGRPKPDYARIAVRALVNYWPMWIAGALFVVMQWGFPFVDWWKSWNKPHSYYSHGPLVPLISLFMIWANRKRIAVGQCEQSRWALVMLPFSLLVFVMGWVLGSTFVQVIGAAGIALSGSIVAIDRINPSVLGVSLLCVSLPLFVFGRWTGSGIVCSITFFGFLIGGLLLFTGRATTKLLLFPILYLFFMIPAPATVLDNTTFRIQMFSTTLAAKILNATGYAVTQVGSEIRGPDLPDTLRVGTVCSGFRMLISLLTFTAFFVYMLRAPLWKKGILVVLAFPLSTFVNALRIASIGYIGIWTGSSKAMFKFHDTWAMAFELILSFAILFGFAKLIRANDFGLPEPTGVAGPGESETGRRTVGGGLRGAAVIGVFAVVMLTNVAVHPLETTAKGYLDAADFPKSFNNWVSQEVPLDPMSASELKTAAMIQRVYRYTVDDLPNVQVLVQAAADTDAFHDPHSCLPGGGSSIVDEKRLVLRFDKPKPMAAHATMLRSVSEMGDEFVLIYWYDTESDTYATTSQVRWKMRIAQIRDIADLLLRRATNEKVRERTAKRQTYCFRFSALVGADAERDRKALMDFIRELVANSKRFDRR